jgi:hypothetical protein
MLIQAGLSKNRDPIPKIIREKGLEEWLKQ